MDVQTAIFSSRTEKPAIRIERLFDPPVERLAGADAEERPADGPSHGQAGQAQ